MGKLGMSNATDQDIFDAMLRLWGRDATDVALGYAEQDEMLGNKAGAARWRKLAHLVETHWAVISCAKTTALLDGP
jgi:hypothetical protein